MSSKEVLRNLCLNNWQQDWDSGDAGRATSNILPKVALTKPHGQENPSFSLQATIPFPAISTDSCFIILTSAHSGKREELFHMYLSVTAKSRMKDKHRFNRLKWRLSRLCG
ncbi:hypothetical protein AVEN_190839-1 [Araneus ventricosus]|uniref:Uncharacterized protein n=1 Tax=Araneus ventricosus TaxID=182803 RepID=A0A4Y2DZL8_ARAVE|nr:hypothetical protein AVEN_190839-1 [Araneus ventricosus]